MVGYNENGNLVTFDDGTNCFVWKGRRYGKNTQIKLRDEFLKDFRWNGEEISNQGIFLNMYIKDNIKMYQFEKYSLDEWKTRHFYPIAFSLTELELINAIECITRPTYVEEWTACKPPNADKQLEDGYQKDRQFFKWNGKYYGSGSKIYFKDEFIDYYKRKTGRLLSKKMMFMFSSKNPNPKIKKHIYNLYACTDMMQIVPDNYNGFFKLEEEEFFEAIEIVKDCHLIKIKDVNEPTVFIFWAIYIFLMCLSCIIFVAPAPLILVFSLVFFKFRKSLLRR